MNIDKAVTTCWQLFHSFRTSMRMQTLTRQIMPPILTLTIHQS